MTLATLSGLLNTGVVSVSGSGYVAGERVALTYSFTSTDNKRRFSEMRIASADGAGALAANWTPPFAGGSVVTRAFTGSTQTTLAATSGSVAV